MRAMKPAWKFVVFLLAALLAGCQLSSSDSLTLPESTAPTHAPAPYPTPNLNRHPLIWFAPLPPLKQTDWRPFIGSEDFMQLFEVDSPWSRAAGRIQVFKLSGEWVGTDSWNVHASDSELRQVVEDLNRRGIALAMEGGPLEPSAACGQEIEGFGGGASIGIRDARRIQNAGGTLVFIALDEPFYFAHIYSGERACQWTAEKVAQEVGAYIQGVRSVFPDVLVGDIEPLLRDVDAEEYKTWLTTFRAVNGYDLAFFHLDVDYSRADWPQAALALEDFVRSQGIDFGIIYTGSRNERTDEEWLISAGERVKTYELETGGQPDHVLFQSWHDHPDHVLPESQPYTFTWFINAYLDDRAGLGVRTDGPGANLAYRMPATASSSNQAPPENAVDGNSDTAWGAGGGAPQWIEIDLAEPSTIAELRLLTAQSPDGETTHRVLVRGEGEAFREVHRFTGTTADLQWLTVRFAVPLEGVRYVRIETLASPSWVAWREIQVIAGE